MFGGIHSVWSNPNNLFLPCMNYWLHRDTNGDNCKSIFNQGYSLSLLMREKICLHCYCSGTSFFIWAQVCHTYRKWQKGKLIWLHLFWIIHGFGVSGHLFPLCHLKTVTIFCHFLLPPGKFCHSPEKKMFQKFKSFDKDLTSQM